MIVVTELMIWYKHFLHLNKSFYCLICLLLRYLKFSAIVLHLFSCVTLFLGSHYLHMYTSCTGHSIQLVTIIRYRKTAICKGTTSKSLHFNICAVDLLTKFLSVITVFFRPIRKLSPIFHLFS